MRINHTFFTNKSANGASLNPITMPVDCTGVLTVTGTLDGATITVSVDTATGDDLAITTAGPYALEHLKEGAVVELTVSGAGASTSITARMRG